MEKDDKRSHKLKLFYSCLFFIFRFFISVFWLSLLGEDFAFGFRNVKIRPLYFLYLFFYLFDDEQLGGRRSPFSFTFTAISPRRNIFLLFSMSLIAVVVCQCCRFFFFFSFCHPSYSSQYNTDINNADDSLRLLFQALSPRHQPICISFPHLYH